VSIPELSLFKLWTGNEKVKAAKDTGKVLPAPYMNWTEQVTFLSSMDQLCRLDVPSTLTSAFPTSGAGLVTGLIDITAKAHKQMTVYFINVFVFALKEISGALQSWLFLSS
jgi:hypothetical protein